MSDFFLAPFAADAPRDALVAMLALALGAGPAGVFLMLRRMSLMGDTMAHAILPGVAVAVAVAGLDMFAMTIGGIVAGLVVALLAGLVARATQLKEDASLAAFFLIFAGARALSFSPRRGVTKRNPPRSVRQRVGARRQAADPDCHDFINFDGRVRTDLAASW